MRLDDMIEMLTNLRKEHKEGGDLEIVLGADISRGVLEYISMQAEPEDGEAILLMDEKYLPSEKQKPKNCNVYNDLDLAIEAFDKTHHYGAAYSWWCNFATWCFKEYKE